MVYLYTAVCICLRSAITIVYEERVVIDTISVTLFQKNVKKEIHV